MFDPAALLQRNLRHLRCFACIFLLITSVTLTARGAEDNKAASAATPDQYKAGYTTKPAFGGPNSPEGQLEEDDRVKEPAFRFPAVYDFFAPWRNWMQQQNEDHGFEFSGHNSSLYQGLSDSITSTPIGISRRQASPPRQAI